MAQGVTRPPRKSVVGRPRPGQYLAMGIVGGFLAGVALIALWSWFAVSRGAPQLSPFRLVASLAQGPAAAIDATGDLWLGMLIHSLLAAIFGLIFALVTVSIRSARLVALAGPIFGAIVYVVNFQVLARLIGQFSAFRTVNQPFEASVHLVYGSLVAVLLLVGARRDAGLKDPSSWRRRTEEERAEEDRRRREVEERERAAEARQREAEAHRRESEARQEEAEAAREQSTATRTDEEGRPPA
jgi:hypothetical protein